METEAHGDVLLLLHREALERVLLMWAAEQGIVEMGEDVHIDWLYGQAQALTEEGPFYFRLSKPE